MRGQRVQRLVNHSRGAERQIDGSEAFPEVEQPLRRHATLVDEVPASGSDVECQPLLAGVTGVAAVPAVVEEQRGETRRGEVGGE
ncbi:hypothetical protein I1A62_25805 [Rhodococcus sp. USK10]|nr:hypothetical protein I1A62_25805 [Rhodococcus sp. USK10]